MNTVAMALLTAPKLKLKPQNISVRSASVVDVSPPDAVKSTLHYSLQSLKAQLPLVIVKVGG